jgi:O-antigen chain-terminating methyltransferase
MDPTHRNPLPPEALRWFVEARGFLGARIERLVAARGLSELPLLPENAPGAASINAILAALNAAPDYAIVAKRP